MPRRNESESFGFQSRFRSVSPNGSTRQAQRTATRLPAGPRDGSAGGRASALGSDPALLREASGLRADPRARRDRRRKGVVQGRLSHAPLRSADEQFLSEGPRWHASRDLASRRPAVRCRGDLGKLARSSDGQMGADVRRRHRAGQRTGRADPRSHAGDTAERFVRTLAKRRGGSPRSAGAIPADQLAVSPQRSRR
jgi:hypothetical protein